MGLIASSKWHPPKEPSESFVGRTILVTGSNTGLGLQTSIKFAALGAKKIILAVRNTEKGERAKSEVAKHASDKIDIEVRQLDMLNFSSVRDFAAQLISDLGQEPLDIAVLNAGVTHVEPHKSPEGWNAEIQVNVLSTVLLAILLLPKLKASKTAAYTPTMTFTSSGNHRAVPLSQFEVQSKDTTSNAPVLTYWSQPDVWPGSQPMYNFTKLLLEFAVGALASHRIVRNPATDKLDVIVDSCCPGACATDLARDYHDHSMFFRVAIFIMFNLISRTAEQGSRTIVSATALGEKGHGQFWQNDILVKEDRGIMTSPQKQRLQDSMWAEIVGVLINAAPEVESIIGPVSKA